jgi:hypothetical protein
LFVSLSFPYPGLPLSFTIGIISKEHGDLQETDIQLWWIVGQRCGGPRKRSRPEEPSTLENEPKKKQYSNIETVFFSQRIAIFLTICICGTTAVSKKFPQTHLLSTD